MREFGTVPAGAFRYAVMEERGCRAEFIALSPPAPGDALCAALTGFREDDLAAAILAGQYDGFLAARPGRTEKVQWYEVKGVREEKLSKNVV